jgi:hypothetical protein
VCKLSHAQEVENLDGDLSILKEQKIITVEFVYEGMKVGDFTEEQYLQQKRASFRKAPDYDKFAAKWVSDRKDNYEPKFIEQFNTGVKKIGIELSKDDDNTEYTLIVTTTKTEPGYYAGAGGTNRDTYINLTFSIVKTSDNSQVKATFEMSDVTGIAQNNAEMKDMQLKIKNAYGIAGFKVGRFFVKHCK